MAELISSGRDPDKRPPPRAPIALAAVLIAVAALVSYQLIRGGPATHSTPARAGAGPTDIPSLTTPPHPVAPAELRCGQHCDAPILHGRPGTGPVGLRLLIGTAPPTILDAAGHRHRGPRLPLRRGEHIDTLLPMGSDAVALLQPTSVTESTPPGRVYRLGADGSTALLGRADALIRGVGATVWTMTYPRPGGGVSAPYTLAELDRTGRVLARHTESPGMDILRATSAGLLVTLPRVSDGSYYGSPQTLAIFNPTTGNIDQTLSDHVFAVLDATDNRVAWTTTVGGFHIAVYDLAGGQGPALFSAPGYHPPDYGRFSPDQRTLALGFSGLPQLGNNPASYGYLQVLDLISGSITPISGLRTSPESYAQLQWTADSRTLVLGLDDHNFTEVAFWTRPSRKLTVLPTTVPHSDNSAFGYLVSTRQPRG